MTISDRAVPGRRQALVALVACYLVAATAVPYLAASVLPALPNTLAGATLLVCGLLLVDAGEHGRGRLLLLGGVAWFMPDLAPVFEPPLRTALEATSLVWVGFLTHAAVAVSDPTLSRRTSRVATVLGYAVAVAAPTGLGRVGLLAAAGGLVVVAADAAVWRGHVEVRGYLGSAVPLVLASGLLVATLGRLGSHHVSETTLSRIVVLAVVSVGVLSAGPIRSTVARPTGESGADATAALAAEIGDLLGQGPVPVCFPSPAGAAWIDYSGRPAEVDPMTLELVGDRHAPVAGLGTAATIPPLVMDDLVQLLALAAEHARLNFLVRQRTAALETSRRRLIESSDDERVHLQAALREGASASLDRAVRSIPASPNLGELVRRGRSTRAGLASIARGIDPLGDRGLRESLEDLAAGAGVPVSLSVMREPDGPVARTIWFACSEALANVQKHAPMARVVIALDGGISTIRLTITDDGPGGADAHGHGLRGLADRAAALGGEVQVSSGSRGTRIELVLPLDEAS